MSTYQDSLEVDRQGVALITSLINIEQPGHLYIEVPPRNRQEQQLNGDFICHLSPTSAVNVELKTERLNKHGNLYLEEDSNKRLGIRGWMHHYENVQWLWYLFLATRELYSCDFQELKTWFFANDRHKEFPLKPQRACEQNNDTWGRCVPIERLSKEITSLRVRKL